MRLWLTQWELKRPLLALTGLLVFAQIPANSLAQEQEVSASPSGTTGAGQGQTGGQVQPAQAGATAGVPEETVTEQDAPSGTQNGMNSKAMGELPLNGRSASDVAALEPGVIKVRTQGAGGGIFGYGSHMTIFGSRPRGNDSRIDGISVNDYANSPQGNAIGINLGVDALERLTVLTSNDQAEFGRSSGGYISSATRSGTNSFHGSVFEYLRNSALDAKNYFDKEKPPFIRNQFGFSVGGPIWKDRTFIFGDYEGIRQSQGQTNVSSVPSAAARAGNICSVPNGGCTPSTLTVDPQARRFVDAFYPLPNRGSLGAGDTGVFVSAGQKVTPGNHFSDRVDHKLSAADLLSAVYIFDRGTVSRPDQFNQKIAVNDSQQHFVSVHYSRTFSPRTANSFRIGINRFTSNTGITLPGSNSFMGDPSYGSIPSRNAPRVDVSGLAGFNGGLGALGTYDYRWTSIQAHDDVSVINGGHAFKFGVSLERIRDNILGTTAPNGLFVSSLTDLLTNRPYSFSGPLSDAPADKSFRQTVFGAYFQDDWRLRPNFLMSLGLRYEISTPLAESYGRLSSLRNLTDVQPQVGSQLFANSTARNFEPRVGFAWDPFSDGLTVVSSGFGIFDVLPLPYEVQLSQLFVSPFYEVRDTANLPQGSFPGGAFSIAASSSNTARMAYFERAPHRNYVMQWNFTVERQLPFGMSTKIGYTGSRGVHHVFRVDDADIVLPTLTPAGYAWPSNPSLSTRLNPQFGRIEGLFWNADSFYDAFVFQMTKRIGRRGQIAGSYTWGKSIDTTSGSIRGGEYLNSISSPLWFDTSLNRGLSDFDIKHNLKIIYSWELPAPKLNWAPLEWGVDGWQIGGIVEVSSGVPFTPKLGGDPLGLKSTDPTSAVPDVISSGNCSSLVNPGNPIHYIRTECFSLPNPKTLRGNAGRNILIGPGLLNFDFSVFKNNYIREISGDFNVQFRAEVFNIMNRANFNAPLGNSNLFDASGAPVGSAGLVDSTQTSSRQIQFAIKLIW